MSGHCIKLSSLYLTLNEETLPCLCLFFDTGYPCDLGCMYGLFFLALLIAICITELGGNTSHRWEPYTQTTRHGHGCTEIIASSIPSAGAFTSCGEMSCMEL